MSELWILTGPNGAGKSTYAPSICSDFKARTGEAIFYFNPDEEMRKSDGDALKVFECFYISTVRRLLADRRGVLIETPTVPGRTIFNLISDFRDAGYRIGVTAIGVATIDLAKESVKNRKAGGGHDVADVITEATYKYCQKQTPRLLTLSDEAHVYDRNAKGELTEILSYTDEGFVMHRSSEIIQQTNPYMTGLLRELSLHPQVPVPRKSLSRLKTFTFP